MKLITRLIPCDIVMPSIGDQLKYLVEDHFIAVIILLAILLVVASTITVVVVTRREKKEENLDLKHDVEDNNS